MSASSVPILALIQAWLSGGGPGVTMAAAGEKLFRDLGCATCHLEAATGRGPSLRNLLLTAPYGRDGNVDTIAQIVQHHVGLDPARMHANDGRPPRPPNLTPREQTDLVVFLESLSTFSNPWRPDEGGHCD